MNSLTVAEKDKKIQLAYYAKGRTATASMLLARYQLYGSVYWHHTYRCLHAMLYYATQLAFGHVDENTGISISRSKSINLKDVRSLYYYRVLCKYTWEESWSRINQNMQYISANIRTAIKNSERMFPNDYSLGFIYVFTTDDGKALLRQVKERNIHKRIYSKNLKGIEIADLARKCNNRISVSKKIQESLLEAIKTNRITSDRNETQAEVLIENEYNELEESIKGGNISVIIDFPQKIKIPIRSWSSEIGDSARRLQNYGREEPIAIQGISKG